MRSRHLPYLGAELLCFAPLILPMGEKYHLCPSESQPALGLLYLGEYGPVVCAAAAAGQSRPSLTFTGLKGYASHRP